MLFTGIRRRSGCKRNNFWLEWSSQPGRAPLSIHSVFSRLHAPSSYVEFSLSAATYCPPECPSSLSFIHESRWHYHSRVEWRPTWTNVMRDYISDHLHIEPTLVHIRRQDDPIRPMPFGRHLIVPCVLSWRHQNGSQYITIAAVDLILLPMLSLLTKRWTYYSQASRPVSVQLYTVCVCVCIGNSKTCWERERERPCKATCWTLRGLMTSRYHSCCLSFFCSLLSLIQYTVAPIVVPRHSAYRDLVVPGYVAQAACWPLWSYICCALLPYRLSAVCLFIKVSPSCWRDSTPGNSL